MPKFNLSDLLLYTKQEGDCLIWQRAKSKAGYGQIWDGSKVIYAHRAVAFFTLGNPATGQEVMHSCDMRSCVNPAHLSYGTRKENMIDASRKGRLYNKRHAKGMDNPNSRLTWSQIQDLRQRRLEGTKLKDLASDYEISIAAVSKIARGEVRQNA